MAIVHKHIPFGGMDQVEVAVWRECERAQDHCVAMMGKLADELAKGEIENIDALKDAHGAQLGLIEVHHKAILFLLSHWAREGGDHDWVVLDWAESAWGTLTDTCNYFDILPDLAEQFGGLDLMLDSMHQYMWSGLQRMVAEHLPYVTKALHERMKGLGLPVDGFEWHETSKAQQGIRAFMHNGEAPATPKQGG